MMTVFDIRELTHHILSFVPRTLIGPCLFVNKKFNNAIPINNDYKNAVKNGDLFSLNKIMYSPIDALQIAKNYKHKKIIEYLIKYKQKLLEKYGYIDNIFQTIGYIGDNNMFKSFSDSEHYYGGQMQYMFDLQLYLPPYMIGLCEGMHYELVEEYKQHISLGYSLSNIISNAFKQNDSDAIFKATELFKYYNTTFNYDTSKMHGLILSKNISYSNLEELIEKDLSRDKFVYICSGLFEGGHYKLFKWLMNQDKIKNFELTIDFKYKLYVFVINDDYNFFSHILLNYSNLTCGLYTVILKCIDYRRIDMLLLLFKHIKFDENDKNNFIERCDCWGYDDIKKIIIEHIKIDI